MSREIRRMTALSSADARGGKKRFLLPLVMVLMIILLAFSFSKKEPEITPDINSELPIEPTAEVIYPKYPEGVEKLEGLKESSEYILIGTVEYRGEPILKTVKDGEGNESEVFYTPIGLRVEEIFKGEINADEFIYMELGGQNSQRKIEAYGVTPLYVDDRVLLFADSEHYGYGNYSVFQIINNQISVLADRLPKEYQKEGKRSIKLEIDDLFNFFQ